MNKWNISRLPLILSIFFMGISVLAASDPIWSSPVNVSGWQQYMEPYRIVSGTDGTHAVFYPIYNPSLTNGSLWGRVRDPGGDWSSAVNISGVVSPGTVWNYKFWDAVVSPDGTAWVIWSLLDGSAPAGKEAFVAESHRSPGGSWSAPHLLSAGNATIRGVDLHSGPDGHLAAAWVECDTTSSDLTQGNCNVDVSRRSPGAPSWEARKKVDQSTTGVNEVYVRIGPGGLVVVIWSEGSSAFTPPRYMVKANEFNPGSGWGSSPVSISDWAKPRQDRLLSDPVMDGGGTVTAAWYAASPPGSSYSAIFSNTRTNASGWGTNFTKICADTTNTLIEPLLAVAQDGTVAAVWWRAISSAPKSQAVSANARDPGGNWGASELNISNWEDQIRLTGLDMWPDGTAVALWSVRDETKPASADSAVFWSARYGGLWGGGGNGRLGNWSPDIFGSALKLSHDGGAVAIWAEEVSTNQYRVMSASWPPGGPWNMPGTIADGYGFAAVDLRSLALGAGGRDFGAAWYANDKSTPSKVAFFYASTARNTIFLPLSVR